MTAPSANAPAARWPQCRLLIGGRWTEGAGSAPVLDKFRMRPFAHAHLPSRAQAAECVSLAQAAYRQSMLDAHARTTLI